MLTIQWLLGTCRSTRNPLTGLDEKGHDIFRSGVQTVLNSHRLGRRSQRHAAATRLVSFTDGILTDAAVDPERDLARFPRLSNHPYRVGLDGFERWGASRGNLLMCRRAHSVAE
jgi:hypothetical protein